MSPGTRADDGDTGMASGARTARQMSSNALTEKANQANGESTGTLGAPEVPGREGRVSVGSAGRSVRVGTSERYRPGDAVYASDL
ncbi:hypothetical protein [Streptomyces sp. NPDC088400]|uniref:hypothetical protein n=1 Tax=Streptomyces sp. NPDC088400 TaxID=3365861 RepID=UPI003812A931